MTRWCFWELKAAFFPSLNCILFIDSVAETNMYVVKCSCLPYFKIYSIEVCSISAKSFSTTPCSSSVNCSKLISSWWIFTGLSVISKGFPGWFLKYSFYFLTGHFEKCFWHIFPSAHCFYCLPRKSWLYIFYWISNYIDLNLYQFSFSFWYVLVL